MKGFSRDLLLLSKDFMNNEEAIELEVKCLQQILQYAESMNQFCIANEVIDVNRYKIISQPTLVHKAIYQRKNKPFVFINCKN